MIGFTECQKPRRRPEGPVLVVIDAKDARAVIERQPLWSALAALCPEKRLHLAITQEARALSLLGADPCIGELHLLPSRRGWLAKGQRRGDLARLYRRIKPRSVFLVTDDTPQTLWDAFVCGIPERRSLGLGHTGRDMWASPGPQLSLAQKALSRLDQNTAFLSLFGHTPQRPRPQLHIRPQVQKDLWGRLMGELGAPARPWLVLGTDETLGEQGLSHLLCHALSGGFRTLFWVGPGPLPEGLVEALSGQELAHRDYRRPRPPRAHLIDASGLDGPERLALYDLCDLILAPESQRLAEAAAVGARAYGFYDADQTPRTPGLTPLHAKGALGDMTPDEALALLLAHYPGAGLHDPAHSPRLQAAKKAFSAEGLC